MTVLRGISRLGARIGAGLALLCLLAGIPVGLCVFVGWPLPHHLTTSWHGVEAILTSPMPDNAIIDLIAVALWIVWAAFAYSLILEIAAAPHGRGARRRRLLSPMQGLAAALVAAIIAGPTLAVAAAPLPAAVAAAPASAAAQPWDQLTTTANRTAGQPTDTAAPSTAGGAVSAGDEIPRFAVAGYDGQLTVQAGAHHYTVTVHRHDTLWDIADRWLGDPLRWPEIYHLNADRYDQHGRMHHGNLILPGWVLVLPADATPPAGATPTPGPGHGSTKPPTTPTPTSPSTAPPSHTPASTPPSTTPSPLPSTDPSAAPAVPATPTAPVTIGVAPSPTASAVHPTPAPSAPAAAGPTSSAAPSSPAPHAGVDLGNAGWLTAEVALAIAGATALVWVHRRRRYQPGSVNPDRDDTDLRPAPRTIAAIHHARTPAEDNMDPHEPDRPDAATVTTASLGARFDRTQLRLPDLPGRGVGLTGPGGPGAARGVLAAILSAGGPWTPEAEATAITTHTDLHELLTDTAEPAALARLHVADDIDTALAELERQLLRRARVATVDADVTSDPNEPSRLLLAPLVLVTAAPIEPHATRLAAILTVGARLGITAILRGDWPHGDTWQVRADGTTGATADGPGPRLNVLDPATTADILATLAEAHPDDDAPQTPHRPARTPIDRTDPVRPSTSPAPAAVRPSVNGATRTPTPPPPADGLRLRLSVLGRATVDVLAGDQASGLHIRRTDGIQILVHLAVNPHGATSDELMVALWPEVRPHYSRSRFHTTMSELRGLLDEAIGAEAIPRTGDRYRLDPDLVDIDLWRLTAAIDHAATALEPAAHIAALHEIINLYRGTIAEGHSWLWLTPQREQLRRHILDAHIALADAAADPQTALGHVQDAIRLDPYNEDVYQRAMVLHAKLGSLDGVRRTLRALAERLAELEIRVSPHTQQVASELTARLDARQRVSGSAA